MKICKNKSSGKYFIYISPDWMRKDRLWFITPEGEEKPLSLSLFDDLEDMGEDCETAKLSNGTITEPQMKAWSEYEKLHSDETVQLLDAW